MRPDAIETSGDHGNENVALRAELQKLLADRRIAEMRRPSEWRSAVLRIPYRRIGAALDQQARAGRAAPPCAGDMQRGHATGPAEAGAAVDVGAMIKKPGRRLDLLARHRPMQRRAVVRLAVDVGPTREQELHGR